MLIIMVMDHHGKKEQLWMHQLHTISLLKGRRKIQNTSGATEIWSNINPSEISHQSPLQITMHNQVL